MTTLSALDDQCSACDRSPLISYPGTSVDKWETSELAPRLRLDALTPVPLEGSLAGHSSSPSLREQLSGVSALTTPLSSPLTECDTTYVDDKAGKGTKIACEACDLPTEIMTSSGLGFGRTAMSSPPPQQVTTGAKRSFFDSDDEVRHHRLLLVHLIRQEAGLDFHKAHETYRGCHPILRCYLPKFLLAANG